MKSFLFTPTKEQKQHIVDLINECEQYVKKKICPPKPTDVSKGACAYCPYKNACKENLN